MSPNLKLVSKWVLPFGYGICLGSYLVVREDSKNLPRVIAHELAHYNQWQLEGSYLKWLAKYIVELLRVGYTDNEYEKAARHLSDSCAQQAIARSMLNAVKCL